MEAILIECCFIDSAEDMNRYDAESMANAIVLGLVGRLPEEPKPQPIQEGIFYRVVVGFYQDRSNADDMVNKLKSQGIESFIDIYKK